MKRIVLLGSTGSIGRQALEIIAMHDELEVVALAADDAWRELLEQAHAHGVKRVAVADSDAAERATGSNGQVKVLGGAESLIDLVVSADANLVVNAIVGSAGLGPTVAALGEGIDLALANKESLVVAGDLVMQLAEATGTRILPIDSEHSALYQLIGSEPPGSVERLVLTASGGPFRGQTAKDLVRITPEQALDHPTWKMGSKITIDSATLMNKGLELIEAHHLFGTPYDSIEVVVHPQSIVHSFVHLNDGATLAHLGYPDMRVPISYALNYPERVDVPVETLDLAAVGALTFEQPDTETFRCLALARDAAQAGGSAPCVLNAANEQAVAAFLDGRIGFLEIAAVIETALEELPATPVGHFTDLYGVDEEARRLADGAIEALGSRERA